MMCTPKTTTDSPSTSLSSPNPKPPAKPRDASKRPARRTSNEITSPRETHSAPIEASSKRKFRKKGTTRAHSSSSGYSHTTQPRALSGSAADDEQDDLPQRPISPDSNVCERTPNPHMGENGSLPVKYRLTELLQEAKELPDSDLEDDDEIVGLKDHINNDDLDLMLAAVDDDMQALTLTLTLTLTLADPNSDPNSDP